MSKYQVLHNPRCSKSRQTVSLLEDNNIDFEIVEYLKNPPSGKTLKSILTLLGAKPRDIMRKNEAEFKQAGLDNQDLSDAELIKLMVDNPKVIERPIVFNQHKAIIGRPPENVLELV